MNCFRDIVNLWPTAEDLGRDLQVPGGLVRLWRRRDSIPAGRWLGIVRAASERGFPGVTLDLLASLAERHERQERAA